MDDLPDEMRTDPGEPTSDLGIRPGTSLRDVERVLILRSMEEFDGNRARVAEVLGISLRTLQRKLKEYGFTRNG